MSSSIHFLERNGQRGVGVVTQCSHSIEKLKTTLGKMKNYGKQVIACKECGQQLLILRFMSTGLVTDIVEIELRTDNLPDLPDGFFEHKTPWVS